MGDLTAAKLRKLEEQKEQSDRLNDILCRDGGLIDSQHQTCKNLVAAVAVSKQPGFFEYYQHNDQVRRVYETNECGALVKRIARTQKELDVIEGEIKHRETTRAEAAQPLQSSLSGLDQWFQQRGARVDFVRF